MRAVCEEEDIITERDAFVIFATGDDGNSIAAEEPLIGVEDKTTSLWSEDAEEEMVLVLDFTTLVTTVEVDDECCCSDTEATACSEALVCVYVCMYLYI